MELPELVVYPAEYHFNSILNLNGEFAGHIEGKKVSIEYVSGEATITGTANEEAFIDFKDEAWLPGV